jgi:hypothetical protein
MPMRSSQVSDNESEDAADDDDLMDTQRGLSSDDMLFDDPKMTAERLRDDDGDPTLQLHDVMEEDITEDSPSVSEEEPLHLQIEQGDETDQSGSAEEPRERQGEGRDTLIPDQ